MRLAFAAVFLLLAVFLAVLGGRLLVTGRNFSGLLGRGITRDDNSRLARAPASYFRAMGSMVLSLGALFALGPAISLESSLSDGAVVAFGLLAALIFCVLLGSLVWFVAVGRRYKLSRFDKP